MRDDSSKRQIPENMAMAEKFGTFQKLNFTTPFFNQKSFAAKTQVVFHEKNWKPQISS